MKELDDFYDSLNRLLIAAKAEERADRARACEKEGEKTAKGLAYPRFNAIGYAHYFAEIVRGNAAVSDSSQDDDLAFLDYVYSIIEADSKEQAFQILPEIADRFKKLLREHLNQF